MNYVDAMRKLFDSKQGTKARRLSWKSSGLNAPEFVYLVGESEFTANKEPLISMFGDKAKFYYSAHVDAYYWKTDEGIHCLSAYIPTVEDRNGTDWIIEDSNGKDCIVE